MRAVLIVMSEEPASPPDSSVQATGRPLPLRQLDFALACRCEQVLALGDATSPDVALLGRAARSREVVVRVVGDSHGLLGLLNTTDELLVLSAGVLPESTRAVAAFSAGPGVLVLPADAAVPAGFERIDRDRAWAGAALIPGSLVERLSELPPDSDAPAALLRIALQARVPDRRLPEAVLAEGSWAVAEDGGVVPLVADGWRRRQLEAAEPYDLTGQLAQAMVRQWPEHLLPRPRIIHSLNAGSILLLVGAIVLAWYGYPAPGLALLAPSALSAALAATLATIGAGPFPKRRRRRWRLSGLQPAALDLALAACGALAIGGAWTGRLFPPLVLLIALHGRRPAERPVPLALLGDRMVLALLAALATALGLVEPVLMLLALAFLLGDRFSGREPPARR